MYFRLENMVHLAGFERAFVADRDKIWHGPVLTLGPMLSDIEMDVDGDEPEDMWSEEDPDQEFEKSKTCIMLYLLFPTSPIKSLKLRAKGLLDIQSSWPDLKEVITSIHLQPMHSPNYIEAIWEIVVEGCLMSRPFTDADIADAGNFLKESLRDISATDLQGVCDTYARSLITTVENQVIFENQWQKGTSRTNYNYHHTMPLVQPRTYTRVAQNFTRMLRLFPSEISEMFLPRFAGLLGSKFLVVDDNVAVAIRLLFELMSKESEGRFTSLIRKIFVQHPSENLRRMLDAEIKSQSSPGIVEIWGSQTLKIHDYIVEGIRKRFESNLDRQYAYTDQQVAGYNAPGCVTLGRISQLQWQLTSYLKVLQELEDSDSVRLIVQLLSAIKPNGHKKWVLETLRGVAQEMAELPSSSKLLESQPGAVKTFLRNYQNAVFNLDPTLKAPPPRASLALPKRSRCSWRPGSCGLCGPLNLFLESTTKETFASSNRHGEKAHYKDVSGMIGRDSQLNGYIDVRLTGCGVKGQDAVLTVSKRKWKFQEKHDQEAREFSTALGIRKHLLDAIGVQLDHEGKLFGGTNHLYTAPGASSAPKVGSGTTSGGVKRKVIDLTCD
ncbi:hypothetical protein TWF506_008268 [Arthrobotrys conoides]|uniref:Uncharacterized protein n=1 Tax=Arthrobotrys conoides TaxID=74498 RepID=A0AAN8NLE9_9PEZI